MLTSIHRVPQVLSSSANASGNQRARGSRWSGRLSRVQPMPRLLACAHPCKMLRASTQLLMATACTITSWRLQPLGGGSTLQVGCCSAPEAASMPKPGSQPLAVALLCATGVDVHAHLSTVLEQQQGLQTKQHRSLPKPDHCSLSGLLTHSLHCALLQVACRLPMAWDPGRYPAAGRQPSIFSRSQRSGARGRTCLHALMLRGCPGGCAFPGGEAPTMCTSPA